MSGSFHAGPINKGSREKTRIIDIAASVRDIAGSISPMCYTDRGVDDPDVRRPDTSLARQVLGRKPRTPFREGLEQIIPWFAERSAA